MEDYQQVEKQPPRVFRYFAMTIAAIIILATPFDFDWVPIVGWIDDLLAAIAAPITTVITVINALRRIISGARNKFGMTKS